ncbi:MAG TPA: POTRA domain-containing protein [Terriglobales bacterium]|nr:POTRA domain-containing protein [Terriglobales bacterium]
MNKKLNFIFAILALWLSMAAPQTTARGGTASPQKSPGNSKASSTATYKLVALKVTGTERYTEKEILPASGLQLGQSVGEGDFKEAARRLGDTGLFIDVVYSYSYSGAGTKLELQLTDVERSKLVPTEFENFVWFTDAELLNELQKQVPLYKGFVPPAGTLPDRISDALQAMLGEKQLPGHVDYLRQAKPEGGDLTAIAYRVTDVEIHIRGFGFPGASPEQAALLTTAARKLVGADYARSSLAVVAPIDLLPVYLQRGYLKAAFGASSARVVKEPSSGEHDSSEVEVDAILPVTPGKVYAVSDLVWKGNSAVKLDELQGLIHMPAGEPANAVRLTNDLASVRKLYRSRGYMAAQVTPAAAIDDEKSTVHYDLSVVEGDQYKMGELEIVGLDTQATAHLQNAWTLHEGDPYNADYAKKFLEDTNRLFPFGVSWAVSIHEAVNAKEKTVDVTIRFQAR